MENIELTKLWNDGQVEKTTFKKELKAISNNYINIELVKQQLLIGVEIRLPSSVLKLR